MSRNSFDIALPDRGSISNVEKAKWRVIKGAFGIFDLFGGLCDPDGIRIIGQADIGFANPACDRKPSEVERT